MLINMEEMLKVADKNQFAVGAFNATESSLFRAVVEEAEAQNAPAIVQVAQVNLILPQEIFISM